MWTKKDYYDYLNRQRIGKRAVNEKRKDDPVETKKDNDGPKEAGVDGKSDQGFHVSIEFHISDNRRRDLDGMCATIFDCLIHARGRLLAMYPPSVIECKKGKQGE